MFPSRKFLSSRWRTWKFLQIYFDEISFATCFSHFTSIKSVVWDPRFAHFVYFHYTFWWFQFSYHFMTKHEHEHETFQFKPAFLQSKIYGALDFFWAVTFQMEKKVLCNEKKNHYTLMCVLLSFVLRTRNIHFYYASINKQTPQWCRMASKNSFSFGIFFQHFLFFGISTLWHAWIIILKRKFRKNYLVRKMFTLSENERRKKCLLLHETTLNRRLCNLMMSKRK
jgi:hypothetical protein